MQWRTIRRRLVIVRTVKSSLRQPKMIFVISHKHCFRLQCKELLKTLMALENDVNEHKTKCADLERTIDTLKVIPLCFLHQKCSHRTS